MNNFKFLLVLLISYNLITNVYSKSVEILIKVQNEIITNIDLENEIKYLLFMNPKLAELKNIRVERIAKDSLITEIIKTNELKKFHDFSKANELINIIEKKFLDRYKINSKSEFIEILKDNNLNYEIVRQKIFIEGLWNQFIFNKYSNNIKINEDYLRKNILAQFKNKKKKYEYNLSEIFLTGSTNENLDETLNNLNISIKSVGFENSANIFSSSNTSKNGGLIGWVNELQISEDIRRKIEKKDINKVSEPIRTNGGYLLIKINDKREIKEELNLDKQVTELIGKERNRQLNAFSIIFYKKLKKSVQINEL